MTGQHEMLPGRYFLFVSDPAVRITRCTMIYSTRKTDMDCILSLQTPDTFNVIPVRDFYRFTTRAEIKEMTIEQAELELASKELKRGPVGPKVSKPAEDEEDDTKETGLSMGGLSVYGYRVHDTELDGEIVQGQEEDGEERDFAEKFDEEAEDRIGVTDMEPTKLDELERKLRRSLKKTENERKQAAQDDDDSSEVDSEEEFAREVQKSAEDQQMAQAELQRQQQLSAAQAAADDAAKGKKRKADETAEQPQTKRAKLAPGHVSREQMLAQIKQILIVAPRTKRDLLAQLATRVDLNIPHNRNLMVEVVKLVAMPKMQDGVEVLVLKNDLFNR